MSYKTVNLSYLYLEHEVQEKYERAKTVSGWGKAAILTQIVQTYGKRNLAYYQVAAEADARARGFDQHKGKHFDLLTDWQDLPPYQRSLPLLDPSPLNDIPYPDTKNTPRDSYGKFKCSAQNSAILHLTVLLEQSNIQITITRMMRWYYDNYFHVYLPQLAVAEQHTLSAEL